jgi:hypothetical protein
MASELSPFVEANYGWPFGSSGWNLDMDQNLVKFSYLHDRNIDAIVSSLPAIADGTAYFNTADNRLYFDAEGVRYSSPTPKWFIVTLRSTGTPYQFDGTNLTTTIVDMVSSVAGQSGVVTLTKSDVGLSNVDNTSDINKPVSTAQQTALNLKTNISDLADSSDSLKGNGLVGFLPAGTGAVGRTALSKSRERVTVFDFMSASMIADSQTGTPTLDHMPAFLLARTYALAVGAKLIVPTGYYRWDGSTTFEVDLGKFSFEGEGKVTIDCTNFTGTNAIQVYSSLTYPSAAYYNDIHRFSGMFFKGALVSGRHGMLTGHATNGYNGQCSIWNVTFAKFDRNLHCTTNSWRYSFWNCNFTDALTRIWHVPAGLANSGEVFDFYHCQLFDGAGDIEIACNSFTVNFHGCSILNTILLISGQGVKVDFFGGNLENPGAGAFYEYINITGNTCHVILHGTTIPMNQATLFTDCPFKVAANSVLDFIGVRFPDGSFAFDTSGGSFSFCSGAGVVRATDCSFQPLSGGNKPNLGFPAQQLANGDFETGTTAGWTTTTTGGGGTATVNAGAAQSGSFGLHLVANAASSGITLAQTYPVSAGQMCMFGAAVKCDVVATSGNALQFSFTFKDLVGTTLLSGASNVTGLTSYITIGKSLTRYAPRGTATVTVQVTASNGADVSVDNVIFNTL